jgi:hypothetical protein
MRERRRNVLPLFVSVCRSKPDSLTRCRDQPAPA